jgi:hypothetical protein
MEIVTRYHLLIQPGVQHLVSDFSQHQNERYGNPAPSTDLAGAQHLVTNTISEVTGLRGRGAIAEFRRSHRACHPGMRGSGIIAGRSGMRGASPGGEPLGPSPSRRVGNPVWHDSFTGSVAQSHGSGVIAESGTGMRGPSPESNASPEHHGRCDDPGFYDVRGNGYSHPFIDCSHQTRHVREDIHDVRYRDDNDSYRRATTDPYQAQQPQSPSREESRSPGSRQSPTWGQSPDSRRSPTHFHDTTDSPHRTNREERWREMRAGDDDSFHSGGPSSPERVSRDSTARNAKRDPDDYDRDPSRVLQQSHQSAPDVTRVVRGRKALRTYDGLMRDDVRNLPATRHDDARRSSLPSRWVPDAYDEYEFEQYRPRFTGEEDRITRVCGHEATSSGVQHSTARWAPSPYTQYRGRDSNDKQRRK